MRRRLARAGRSSWPGAPCAAGARCAPGADGGSDRPCGPARARPTASASQRRRPAPRIGGRRRLRTRGCGADDAAAARHGRPDARLRSSPVFGRLRRPASAGGRGDLPSPASGGVASVGLGDRRLGTARPASAANRPSATAQLRPRPARIRPPATASADGGRSASAARFGCRRHRSPSQPAPHLAARFGCRLVCRLGCLPSPPASRFVRLASTGFSAGLGLRSMR